MAHKKRPTHGSSPKKSNKNVAPELRPRARLLPRNPRPKAGSDGSASSSLRSYNIPDYRLEHPEFRIFMSGEGANLEYRIEGDLSATPPPIRESKYLSREQCIAIYRWMLLNRRMEVALENLYKQGKVVGGVYFGLGQEGCSCASAYALGPDDWLGPMIRNQGAMLVRGFSARDIMRQYMAKGDSPTWGRDASSHFGDWQRRNVCAPISMLGELIGVMAGVCLGARLARQEHRGPDVRRRRRAVHRRHLREPELCRRAEAGAGAHRGEQSVGLLDAGRHAVLREGPRRARHRVWHSGRDRGRHRSLPGVRRHARGLRARPSRRRPDAHRGQDDAHERPRHPRRRAIRSREAARVSGAPAIPSRASRITWST